MWWHGHDSAHVRDALSDAVSALPPQLRRSLTSGIAAHRAGMGMSLHRRSRQNGPPVEGGGAGSKQEEDGMGSEVIKEILFRKGAQVLVLDRSIATAAGRCSNIPMPW